MTYSIVAYDRTSGAAGVATVTGGMAVGAFVPHARAGVGAIATQGASTNWLYGERALALLEGGCGAPDVIEAITAEDGGRDYRQCVVVDSAGGTASWTGSRCAGIHEHAGGQCRGAAGNRLQCPGVVDAMVGAFDRNSSGELAERLLAALAAGDHAGGDRNGIVSSALHVDFLDRPPVHLRVDYHPGEALDRLLALYHRFQEAPFKDFYATVPTRQNYGKFRR